MPFYTFDEAPKFEGSTFTLRRYYKIEFERHYCLFCMIRFMEGGNYGTKGVGYATQDGSCWVCEGCFFEFGDKFHFHKALPPQKPGEERTQTEEKLDTRINDSPTQG